MKGYVIIGPTLFSPPDP